jgi:ribonuclease H / adenosylcobalamin/alpha-ribazole phosphatase
MADFLFLRHAETYISDSKKWHGRLDPPLSPKGEAHAHRAALCLSQLDRQIVAVIASDRRRTMETATVLAKVLNRPMSADVELHERDLGDWTGLGADEIERGWPGQLDAWRHGRLSGPPGGETDEEVTTRLTNALLHYADTDSTAPQVVVAHSGLLRGLLATRGMDHGDIEPLSGHWLTVSTERRTIVVGSAASF